MKLAIISHTEHYTTPEGRVVGWSPTVNEINHLLEVFDTIYHLAMHYEGPAPQSTMAYASERIQFIALPSVGGKRIQDKWGIVMQAPKVIGMVSKTLKQVDYFQLRTPMGIGVFLIPYLTLCVKTKGWYKYAGNWNQAHPPLGYRLQRWMLKHQSRKVTLNGVWPKQPQHGISFENPCLTGSDLEVGRRISQMKSLEGPLTFCFVGRLEAEKGVGRILEALKGLTPAEQQRIAMVHFVGEGAALEAFQMQAEQLPVSIRFHGALSRTEVFEIYKIAHAILMPTTASEGFPKVLAEAMAFGCIPVVSNLSAIGQYIQHGQQGFLLEHVTPLALMEQLRQLFCLDARNHQNMLILQQEVCKHFTFEHYHDQLSLKILNP